MPTYDQLDNEAAWRDEYEPPALKALAAGLKGHYLGAGAWIRGDNDHTRGYHRSRRWVKESAFCTDRTYSVSRTSGDRAGGDSNWACALDLGNLPQTELLAACKRLDAAVRAGHLEKITEWYGNLGDDGRVDGYDNIANRLASADSSHLTHLHMSFDRGRANEDHSDVLAVLIGDDMDTVLTHNMGWRLQAMIAGRETIVVPADTAIGAPGFTEPNQPQIQLNRLEAKVAALSTPQSAPVDIAALVAALRPELDAAAERAMRRVMLDAATSDGAMPA